LPTYAVHVNGVTRDGDTTRMWLARRSPAKAVDPGLLDNLVGGGIAAGYRVDETLVKEAFEEAGVHESVARAARPAGIVHSVKPMFDGLQREMLFVHDLELPADFVPANQDGEAVEHRLVDLPIAAKTISATAGPDETTVDASLVVLDYLIRHGHVPADDPTYSSLDALLHRRVEAEPCLRQ
jgi:8-oxo-dGTP pyrophosphatase MutT (NUDIX family)